jgi:hypothetical protein
MNTAYNDVQTSMQGQQNLLAALQAQNGLQNQSQVYGQLQGVVNGTGPNPAQAQLAQATGANTANQAALMAGQRGSSQNAGLIARQAAQQGAANQQNSAGQAATLQATQSLNALQNAGTMASGMASNQIGQTNANTQAQQQEQQNLLSANQGMNMVNAGLIGQTMQQQASIGGGSMNGLGSMMGSMAEGGKVTNKGFDKGGQVNNGNGADITSLLALMAAGGEIKMYANGTNDQPVSNADSTPTDQSAYTGKSKFGAFLKGVGSQQGQGSSSGKSNDPIVQGMGNFGAGLGHLMSSSSTPTTTTPQVTGPGMSTNSKDYSQYQGSGFTPDQMANSAAQTNGVNQGDLPSPNDPSQQLQQQYGMPNPQQQTSSSNDDVTMFKGGKVPALVSPGEKRIKKEDLPKVAKGMNPMTVGKTIPGKPKVGGSKNSYANDTVPMDLNEGDIILPRSVTQSKHPQWAAHKFVHAIMAKNGGKIK